MRTRRKYDRQFKIEAVEYLNSSGKTATKVAADLGIRRDLISRWKKELSEENIISFPGKGNPRDVELAHLKKENASLKIEREILKKALAIFSKPENRNINL